MCVCIFQIKINQESLHIVYLLAKLFSIVSAGKYVYLIVFVSL